jgi:hypothetical protein
MSTCTDAATVLHVCDLAGLDSYNCGNGEYLPSVFDTDAKDYYQSQQVCTAGEGVTLQNWARRGASCTVEASAPGGGEITLPLFQYPYYRALAQDGTKLSVTRSEHGQAVVALPSGFSGSFTVEFCPPWYWHGAAVFSAAFLVLAAVFVMRQRWHGRKNGAAPAPETQKCAVTV